MAAAGQSIVGQLRELKGLKEEGILTQEEFELAKKKVLEGFTNGTQNVATARVPPTPSLTDTGKVIKEEDPKKWAKK